MSQTLQSPQSVSPLLLSHHLLNLAEEADRAGLSRSAASLLRLAHTVCSDRPIRSAGSR